MAKLEKQFRHAEARANAADARAESATAKLIEAREEARVAYGAGGGGKSGERFPFFFHLR